MTSDPLSGAARDIADVLRRRGKAQPGRVAYTWLNDSGVEETALTYGTLDKKSLAVAAELFKCGAKGDRALLLYQPGLEFLSGFFGCLYAGIIGIPAPAPTAAQLKRSLPRLVSIIKDARATFALSTPAVISLLKDELASVPDLPPLRWISTEELAPAIIELPAIDPDDVAYLQYTSGSTSTPKGVVITHDNIMKNSICVREAGNYTSELTGLTWMPYFHDYGLMEGLIQPLYTGYPTYVMSPLAFLKRPFKWLEAISRYRVNATGGPNFAYDYCWQKIKPEQKTALDLSCWKVAHVSAEPVRRKTFEKFVEAFGECGFDMGRVYPCYGLAEATLVITMKKHGRLPSFMRIDSPNPPPGEEKHARLYETLYKEGVRDLVGAGCPLVDWRVEIVDPDTYQRRGEGDVGEVWVADPSVAKGYLGRDEENQRIFGARIADTGDGPFLRTGDLGFMKDGELFITSRLKDLIIIDGANRYPADIEHTVEHCHPSLVINCSAAFSVDVDDSEKLVVVAEVERNTKELEPIVAAIRKAVSENHEMDTFAVWLLKKGSIHKTSSGKIQRHGCKKSFLADTLNTLFKWQKTTAKKSDAKAPVSHDAIAAWIIAKLSERLEIPASRIDVNEPFAAYGLSSREAVGMAGELEEWLGAELSAVTLWEHPTVSALSAYLANITTDADATPVPHNKPRANDTQNERIAIVGMACKFPGADNIDKYWRLLRDGVDAVREVPESRWNAEEYYHPDPATPGKMNTKWGGFVSDVDMFDAEFFGVSPRECRSIDPQQRILLEMAWRALEDAGIAPDKLAGSPTGVFVGVSAGDYGQMLFSDSAGLDAYAGAGNAFSVAANRISYTLDLRGPSLAVDTACSSSLTATHHACRSLQNGECDTAIAGGVNLVLTPQLTVALSQARMMAPDGRCKTFDADADGYVRGEGCGVVILKRLSDAQRDGDNILAVIRGSAINQDGRSNGLTAPNGTSQRMVVKHALENAGVAPEQIDFVETHGTGTSLGDPIEVNALKDVLGASRRCALGAVKTNIGHLESAAGIAGLIKTALSMQHGAIPPNLHFKKLNPHISLDGTGFYIPTDVVEWPTTDGRRLAGVSSFGFGGTNAHIILESAPEQEAQSNNGERPVHILAISAKKDSALRTLAREYEKYLERRADLSLANICHSANTGRAHFARRLAVVGATHDELRERLAEYLAAESSPSAGSARIKTAFLFTGQGAQYVGMGKALFDTHPLFRRTLLLCDEILRPHIGASLIDVIYPSDEATSPVDETGFAQPALFALEYALARVWESWGMAPSAVMGHSVGEYAAACVAGVFGLEDGLKLISARARLMQALPKNGAMAAVFAPLADVERAIAGYENDVSIAAVNAPDKVVISGRSEVIDSILAGFAESRKLKVSHAFHSPLMQPMLDEFAAVADSITYSPPKIDFISNMTGGKVANEVTNPRYWVDHVMRPVLFMNGVQAMTALDNFAYLEIGPKSTLLTLAKECAGDNAAAWLPSLTPTQNDWIGMSRSLAKLYTLGADVDWRGFDEGWRRDKVTVPNYPFERRRHWADVPVHKNVSVPERAGHPLLGVRRSLATPGSGDVWTRTVDIAEHEFLSGHRVEGAIVFPGTAFLEMALTAVSELTGGVDMEFSGLVFEKALIFADGAAYDLQTSVTPIEEGYTFAIYSRPAGSDAAWTRHVKGNAQSADAQTGDENINDILARCPGELSGAEFYATWAERGNRWEGVFAGITRIHKNEKEAVAEITTPSAHARAGYNAHPAILDCCAQTLAALAPVDGPRGAFVGRGGESFAIHAPVDNQRLWCHAVLRPGDGGARGICGDLRIFGDDGRLVGRMSGLRFEFMSQDAGVSDDPARWIYDVKWRKVDSLKTPERASRRLVVIHGADAENLAAAFDDAIRISPANLVELKNTAPNADLVIYIPDSRSATALLKEAADIAKTLNEIPGASKPKLWIVTKGALDVENSGATGFPASALWGLGRTLSTEMAGIWGGLVDIDETTTADALAAAIDNDAEDMLSIRADAVYAARLERASLPAAGYSRKFKKDAAYIITGGLGGLGLATARWMAENGVRRIILIGRTPLPPRSRWKHLDPQTPDGIRARSVMEIEALGSGVTVAALDIADETALRSWLKNYDDEGWPEIRGIIHAAGVVETASVKALTTAKINAMLSAKTGGAVALHNVFTNRPLDFFAMYSSASAIISSPNLAAYAAANAFLDAFAAYRRGLGLPAVSIGWGAWADVGMMARGMDSSGREYRATRFIDVERGMEILDRLLASKSARAVVFPVDWREWSRQYPSVATSPLYQRVIDKLSDTAKSDAPQLEKLRELTPEEMETRLRQWIGGIVARALSLNENALDTHAPLNSLGMDSLMALEIRNVAERELKVSIPVVDLLRGPSVHDLAARFAELMAASKEPSRAQLPVEKNDISSGARFALSHNQKAKWFLYKLAPDSAAYHVAFAFRIHSPIERDVFKRALDSLAARHPALRVRFAESDGEVWQSFDGDGATDFAIIDAAGWNDATLKSAMMNEYRRPFDLESGGGALRVRLFKVADDDYVMMLAVHHIVCDGWSLWIILNDLGAVLPNAGVDLPVINYTYADFTQWQERMLQSADGDRMWDYWRETLGGKLPALNLPTDKPRPPVQTYSGASQMFRLPDELTRAIRKLSQREGVTVYATLLSAFFILLHRYTGQNDILIGAPTTGRSRQEFDNIVGDFVNQVALRAEITGEEPARDLIRRVRETLLGALDNQDYPFPLIVEKLHPARDPSRSPIFQVMFTLQRPQQSGEMMDMAVSAETGKTTNWGGLELSPMEMPQQEGQLDITLEMMEASDSLAGVLKYNTDLFNADTMRGFRGHYQTLLADLARDITQPVARLSMLTDDEKHDLLRGAESVAEQVETRPVHIMFQEQARKTPNAVAVEHGETRLTYHDLNARANRLANLLSQRGVGSGALVGVCLGRTPEMIVALLAVLKAGAAYTPIDPNYPADRIAHMLHAINARALLSASRFANVLGAATAPVIYIDKERDTLEKCSTRNPEKTVNADGLIYAIFTSGSTGTPKAAAVYHRNFSNLIRWYVDDYPMSADDAVMMISSLSFDLTQKNVFAPLSVGARLRLPLSENYDPASYVGEIDAAKITWLNCAPSAFYPIVESGEERGFGRLASVRYVFLGGEPINIGRLKNWMDSPDCNAKIVNSYGPTECADVCAAYTIDRPREFMEKSPPVGKAIPGARLYVLDAAMRPVPSGVVGELYVGGAGVGAGYINDYSLTAEKFVEPPFHIGNRIYKTGDLARLLPDGNVEFLGRMDHQVKIRGFRIETGEIELAINNCPGALDTAVMPRDNGDGEKVLAAYVVRVAGDTLSAEAIRDHIARKLPEYMIPTFITFLDTMPLTPSGKIDRRALPEPQISQAVSKAPTPPATELETTIADIWRDVLKSDRIDVDDKFFDAGGHSLLIVKVHGRLQKSLGKSLPMSDLFQYPTIRSLAGHLAGNGNGGGNGHGAVGQDRAEIRDEKRESMNRQREKRQTRRASGV